MPLVNDARGAPVARAALARGLHCSARCQLQVDDRASLPALRRKMVGGMYIAIRGSPLGALRGAHMKSIPRAPCGPSRRPVIHGEAHEDPHHTSALGLGSHRGGRCCHCYLGLQRRHDARSPGRGRVGSKREPRRQRNDVVLVRWNRNRGQQPGWKRQCVQQLGKRWLVGRKREWRQFGRRGQQRSRLVDQQQQQRRLEQQQ